MTWNIKNVQISNRIVFAPMAGVSNISYRQIIKEFGAGLIYSEMISTLGIKYNGKKTIDLINFEDTERPISIQIFGSDIESIKYAAKYVSEIADVIDINMGCPAPKVVKNGDGSKLLLDLDLAGKIVEAVVNAQSKPVTVKFRKGWNSENVVACEAAKIFESAGASLITIHGRTRADFYTGKADLDIIKKVKESVSIPVIGNGNIVDEESALEMFQKTGVDGIMIGRGSLGNPWIFRNIKHFLKTGERLQQPTIEERKNAMKKHIELAVKNKGEMVATHEIRKHISWYTKNLPNSSEFRNKVNHTENSQELLNLIDEYFKNN